MQDTTEEVDVATETRRKRLAIAHCERVNAGDLDGLLALYSPDVRFEDPMGSGEQVGHDALRRHAGMAVEAGVVEEMGPVVAAQDGVHAAISVTASLSYLPNGPALAATGVLCPPADEGAARLRVRYLMVIGVGDDGRIATMRAYWGPGDITVVTGAAEVTGPAPDSAFVPIADRPAVAQRYVDLMNAGDVDGVVGLFAEDARLADPAGSPPLQGREAVRAHLARAVAGGVREEALAPTGSMDGRSAAIGATVTMAAPEVPAGTLLRFQVAGVLGLDGAGRIADLQVMWGRSDATLVGDPAR
jgi:steroid delta-isomerase